MEYEDQGGLTFLGNFVDEPFCWLEFNLINTLPSGSSIICWTFYWAIFLRGLVFGIINSWETVIPFHVNNFGVKVVTLFDSTFSDIVSYKLGFNVHLGLSWDDNNLKYSISNSETFFKALEIGPLNYFEY